MRRLLLVELTRLRWRRAVLLLVIAAVVVTAIVLAILLYNTRPREQGGLAEFDYYYPELDLRDQLSGSGVGIAALLTAIGMLVGTTFAGHDWTTGSMSNQLLFEPRRGVVWWTKAVVVGVTTTLFSVLVLTVFWAVVVLVAQQRDLTVDRSILSEIVHQVARLSLFTGLASVGTYALTMAFRSTVATLGFLFAAAVAGPILIAVLSFAGSVQPQNQYAAIANDGYTVFDFDQDCFDDITYDPETGEAQSSDDDCETRLTQRGGWVYFGLIVGAVVAGSAVSFGRRDVS